MTADSISNCTLAVDMHPLGLWLHQLKKSLKQQLIPMCSSPSLCGPYPTSIQKRRDNAENLKKTAPVILVETSYLTETNYGKSHVEPGQQIRGDGNFQQQSREEAVALFQLAQLQLEQGMHPQPCANTSCKGGDERARRNAIWACQHACSLKKNILGLQ